MAKKTGGLGRSVFDIFDDNILDGATKRGVADPIKVSLIEPRRDQPRKTFDRESLELLAESISKFGVLQPIIVRESASNDGSFEIIAGERRWRAAKLAGLDEIPAIILEGDELKTAQISIIENIQRENLNPVEEALAYNALIEKFNLTQEQVSKEVGKSRPQIANLLRLLDLPEEVLEMLKNDDISTGHARALLALENDETIVNLAHKIIEKGLSVRDVETTVKKINEMSEQKDIDDAEAVSESVMSKIHIKELEKRSTSALGRKVRITNSAKKKVLEIAFSDDEDLETLLNSVCGAEIFKDL